MTASPEASPGRSEKSPKGSHRDEPAAPDSIGPGMDDSDPDDEVVDEAGEESFPASDSPSSWAGPPSESR
ncbi:MAG TPA: hypothetical protein VID75_06850 [Acidimicrobiales bacterium]